MTFKVFIHIPKNGGMTIRKIDGIQNKVLFCRHGHHVSMDYTKRLEQKMHSTGDHQGYEHARWRDWRTDIREQYKAFAIVRNPWDRVVSRYLFAKKVMFHEESQPKNYADVSSFEAFLEERHKWGNEEFMWHRAVRGWYPAFDHVSDEKGEKVKCDILRFEHYNEDTKLYLGMLQNPNPRNVTRVPKDNGNTGHGLSYKDIYTKETIQIIADWYKKDIDYWGFDFDTPATRNYWNA